MQGFISRQHETHGSTAPSKQICYVREFFAIDKLCEQFRSKLLNNVSVSYKTFRTLHPKWPYQSLSNIKVLRFVAWGHVLNRESLACRLTDSKVGSGEDPGTSPRRCLEVVASWCIGCISWYSLVLPWKACTFPRYWRSELLGRPVGLRKCWEEQWSYPLAKRGFQVSYVSS